MGDAEPEGGVPGGTVLDRYRSYLLVLADLSLDARVRRKVSASDVVQQTLVQAWKHAHQLEGRSLAQQLAWLRKALGHVLSKVHRDLRRQKRDVTLERSLEAALQRSSDVLCASFVSRQPSPSAVAMRNELVLEVADRLARLPAAQRTAVLLYYIEGRNLHEIGALLGRTSVAAGGLIRRGLHKLREGRPPERDRRP